MNLLDLLRESATGRLSHTKLWANVGYGTATWAFVHQVLQHGLSSELLLVYTGVVAASATASKLLALRYQAQASPPSDEPGTTRVATRTETVASIVTGGPAP